MPSKHSRLGIDIANKTGTVSLSTSLRLFYNVLLWLQLSVFVPVSKDSSSCSLSSAYLFLKMLVLGFKLNRAFSRDFVACNKPLILNCVNCYWFISGCIVAILNFSSSSIPKYMPLNTMNESEKLLNCCCDRKSCIFDSLWLCYFFICSFLHSVTALLRNPMKREWSTWLFINFWDARKFRDDMYDCSLVSICISTEKRKWSVELTSRTWSRFNG